VKEERIKIPNLSCQSCALKIERKLKEINEINNFYVDTFNKELRFEVKDPKNLHKVKKEVINKIRELGYEAKETGDKKESKNNHNSHHMESQKKFFTKKRTYLNLFIFLIVLILSLTNWFVTEVIYKDHIFFIFSTISLIVNRAFLIIGLKALLKRNPNMESLISLGVGSAYFYSLILLLINLFKGKNYQTFFDSAVFILFFIYLGKLIEETIKEKARKELEKLLKHKKDKVTVLRNDKEVKTKVDDIKKGEIVIIKPGEEILVDGIVVEGNSEVDESNLTGESYPIYKKKGDRVFSGSLNINGLLKVQTITDGNKTLIQQIKKDVEKALSKKTKLQNLADFISYYFVNTIIVLAILVFFFWLIKENLFLAITMASSVLLIACPCALGIAIPSVVINTISLATKNKIIIKDIEKLEELQKCRFFVFDKTGTLTENIRVSKIIGLEKEISLIKTITSKSKHPISKSIYSFLKEKTKNYNEKIKEIKEIPGKGIEAKLSNNNVVRIGKLEFVTENRKINKIFKEEIKGKIVVAVSINGDLKGIILLEDVIKEKSKKVINFLKSKNKEILVLTGDKKENAEKLEKELDVKVMYELKPNDKKKIIESLKKKGKVCFTGDGINDSLAMLESDVGIVIPNNDLVIKAGDIVIIDRKIEKIITLYKLSEITEKKIRQNLFWAFIYNITAIPIAAGIFYSFGLILKPEIAAIAMSLSSISVLLNSLSIKLYSKKL